MSARDTARALALTLLLVAPAAADISDLAQCQKAIGREGARFAQRVIRSTLKCTNAVTKCQIQCEQGVFGPPCDPVPVPGCCDVDDPPSNAPYNVCMTGAQTLCDSQMLRIAVAESNKQVNITRICSRLTTEELCGATTEGLNFDLLNAACLSLNPSYTCTLTNLVDCVGGPLERQLVDQISSLLEPRAGDALTAVGLGTSFPEIPRTHKVVGTLPPGLVDVWRITGQADDEVVVRLKTRDDNGNGTSNLEPSLVLLGGDFGSPAVIGDTEIREVACNLPNACGAECPVFKRRLPFSGTFHIAVRAVVASGCSGGGYRLIVSSPTDLPPVLVADDIALPPPAPPTT
jgi:hypothetical protein